MCYMADDYVLGNLDNEIARLELQSAFFEPLTRRTLFNAAIKEGMSCLDIGCGAGSVTRIMKQMVGKKGRVVGTDLDEKYVQYCAGSQTDAEFMIDDICNSRLAERGDKFDVVYSRFMFVHLKDVKKAVRSMKQLAKDGAAVIVEELDHAPDSWLCHPENSSVNTLREIYVALVKKAGGDPFAGRKIYSLLVEESLNPIVECHSPCLLMGHEPFSTLGWRIAESLKPQILNYGLLNEQEYAKLRDDLKTLSLDSKSFVTYARLFSVIGRR